MTILSEIASAKRLVVDKCKTLVGYDELEKRIHSSRQPVSLKSSLLDEDKNGIIAEFKKRSPSKGWLNSTADPASISSGYEKANVSGISVLTEQEFFAGSDRDLRQVVEAVRIPVLRKDFILDPYQIYEARSLGADVILLIAALLTKKEIIRFSSLAVELKMEVLLEVHSIEEFEKSYVTEIDIIGVNNRNLADFSVNVDLSFKIAEMLPSSTVKISESGINDASVISQLRAAGYHGFLIGERFMRESDPVKAIQDFIRTLAN